MFLIFMIILLCLALARRKRRLATEGAVHGALPRAWKGAARRRMEQGRRDTAYEA
jgi:hypothetical protein